MFTHALFILAQQTTPPTPPTEPASTPAPVDVASRQDAINAIQTAFRDGSGFIPVNSVIWSIVVLLLGAGAMQLWRMYKSRQLQNGPYVVFHKVARTHGLTLAQQWLLITIARRSNLATPLTLMLSPHTLEHHAAQAAEVVPPRRGRIMLQKARRVRVALFGSPNTTDSPPPPPTLPGTNGTPGDTELRNVLKDKTAAKP